jgi:hypothetical protein
MSPLAVIVLSAALLGSTGASADQSLDVSGAPWR